MKLRPGQPGAGMAKERIVIKVSGRVFGTGGADSVGDYARLLARVGRHCQPVVVAGGGAVARHYISHARSSGADETTLDELGIEVSRLNARLLICALGGRAHPHPPTTLGEAGRAADGGLIVVAGGLHPGQSTNGTAALIAERVGAAQFINATDVDGVYDRDPNRYKDAKMYKRISVGELRGILAREGSAAGGYDLMDMVALKIIERSGIRTRIIRSDPKVLEGAIRGDPAAAGTEITADPSG